MVSSPVEKPTGWPKQKNYKQMKKLSVFWVLVLVVGLVSCSGTKKEKTTNVTPQLEIAWQTDTLLTTCESVLYDTETGKIYVSNINNNPWGIDSNGFISIIDTTGAIVDLHWMHGMSAPKGMGLSHGHLFVCDIDRVVEIDVASQTIVKTYPVDGTPQLNDITVSPDGTVYASGSGSNTIYEISNGEMKKVLTGEFNRLNGLCWQPEGIYMLSSGNSDMRLFNPVDGSVHLITDSIGQGDGIVRLENGDFITSSWSGSLYFVSADGSKRTLLLDTQNEGLNTADIDYIADQHLLLVPTFFKNNVIAFKVKFD